MARSRVSISLSQAIRTSMTPFGIPVWGIWKSCQAEQGASAGSLFVWHVWIGFIASRQRAQRGHQPDHGDADTWHDDTGQVCEQVAVDQATEPADDHQPYWIDDEE